MGNNFGAQTRVLRKAAGITQTDLARIVGTTRQRVSRWEKGRAEFTDSEIMKLTQLVADIARTAREPIDRNVTCWDCNQTQPENEFSADRTRGSGRQSRCRRCARRYAENRRRLSGIPARRRTSDSLTGVDRFLVRDFDELAQLGDGMHLLSRPLDVWTGRGREDLSNWLLIKKLRAEARNWNASPELFLEAIVDRPEVQELLATLGDSRCTTCGPPRSASICSSQPRPPLPPAGRTKKVSERARCTTQLRHSDSWSAIKRCVRP
jgi:transcriptional regulator with XRE-family HTH domain